MRTAAGYFLVNGFVLLVWSIVYGVPGTNMERQQNQAPVVKIISPSPGSSYEWNTAAPYEIGVADKEDGDSKFQEITVNEVLLQVKYFSDSSKMAAAINRPVINDPPGLAVIRTSNCLNCHAFRAPLIGPSLYDISKRYPANDNNIALLAKRIKEGSTGIWGSVGMPTHPELTTEQAAAAVKWILGHAANADENYFIGTEGSFRIKAPASAVSKGYLLLTASYTDHGINEQPGTSLKGQDTKVVKIK